MTKYFLVAIVDGITLDEIKLHYDLDPKENKTRYDVIYHEKYYEENWGHTIKGLCL